MCLFFFLYCTFFGSVDVTQNTISMLRKDLCISVQIGALGQSTREKKSRNFFWLPCGCLHYLAKSVFKIQLQVANVFLFSYNLFIEFTKIDTFHAVIVFMLTKVSSIQMMVNERSQL